MLGLCLPGMECWDGRDMRQWQGQGAMAANELSSPPRPGGIQGWFRIPLCSIPKVPITQEGEMGASVPQLWPQEVCDRDGGSIERQSRVLL